MDNGQGPMDNEGVANATIGIDPLLPAHQERDSMNMIALKSKAFAVRVVRMSRYMQQSENEFVLSKQVLRSGTSIGANVYEATQAFTHADFAHKMSIALKESVETEYWLELLFETGFLSEAEFQSMYSDNKELTKLLTAILKTASRSSNKCSNSK